MKPRLHIHFSLRQQICFFFGKEYFPKENEFLLNHARSGIYLALRSSGIPLGSKVGVMAYNCHTVFNTIVQAGFQPVFIDVTDGLLLDQEDLHAKSEGIAALVVTHLFGLLNDIASIKARYPEVVIIEDCAHAYGVSRQEGDYSVFSVGQGKLPSLGDGGILRVNNPEYLSEVSQLYGGLREYSFLQEMKLFRKLWIKSLLYSKAVYGWFTFPMKKRRSISFGKEILVPVKMSRGIRAIYAKEKDNVFQLVERRRNMSRAIVSTYPGVASRYIVSQNAFMLVLFCDDTKVTKGFFINKGIEAETHFAHSLEWAREFGYVTGSCPNAERIIGHLLMVPTYFRRWTME